MHGNLVTLHLDSYRPDIAVGDKLTTEEDYWEPAPWHWWATNLWHWLSCRHHGTTYTPIYPNGMQRREPWRYYLVTGIFVDGSDSMIISAIEYELRVN